jgi:hypothetical protein
MMKKMPLLVLAVLRFSFMAHAQTATHIVIDSVSRDAFYMEIDMPQSDVKEALDSFFEKAKGEKEKAPGFIFKKQLPYILYKRARVEMMGDDNLDYYFNVDSKKTKGNEVSTIYVAVCKGFRNFISPEDATKWIELKNFSTYLHTNVLEQFRINQKMTTLTKEREKANSKLKDVTAEKIKLETTVAYKDSLLSILSTQLNKLQVNK